MFTIRTYRIPDSIVSSDQRFHVSIATQSNPTIVCELKFPSVPSTSSGARLHLLAIIARSSAGSTRRFVFPCFPDRYARVPDTDR